MTDRSFEAAYEDHVWAVYAFIAYRVRGRSDAEDLTQVTFERALKSWHRYDDTKSPVGGWLIAIARNVLIDHHRRGQVRPGQPVDTDELPEEATGTSPGPEAALAGDPLLMEALAGLTEREREFIGLRYGTDMTGPEIAELTGLNLANVQQILSRALRKLKGQLEAGPDEGG